MSTRRCMLLLEVGYLPPPPPPPALRSRLWKWCCCYFGLLQRQQIGRGWERERQLINSLLWLTLKCNQLAESVRDAAKWPRTDESSEQYLQSQMSLPFKPATNPPPSLSLSPSLLFLSAELDLADLITLYVTGTANTRTHTHTQT